MKTIVLSLVVGSALVSCGKSRKAEVGGGATATPGAPTESVRTDVGSAAGTGASSGSGAASGSEMGVASGAAMGSAAPPLAATTAGAIAPMQMPAGVSAGEWDDNANYRDYVAWLGKSAKGVARLDVADRQFIVVKDNEGKAVPNCTISITAGSTSTSLVSMASGRALWFPGAYGAPATGTAIAQCGSSSGSARLTGKLDGVTELVLQTARQLPEKKSIDLAFVLDTTGSMGEEIEAVKQTIKSVSDELAAERADVRIGLLEYRDRGDAPHTKAYPFSSDLDAFGQSVRMLAAGGGGDGPEDMQKGVHDALELLSWRADAAARIMIVIADAPPHLDYQDAVSYADSAKEAARRGIKVFTVSASGMDDTGQIVMRQMAQFTGAANMFVLRGGAGPQSVGGGDPKSSCGGTHEEYTSGKLDKLILHKLKQEIASIDVDPTRIAGRGQDENARPCDQRITIAY
jgi:Mg-chelatase subunit ChlD